MSSSPLVTIVIPVYNRLQFLAFTLDSVLAQTLADWELIVVDDGSIEDVAGFIARYSDQRISCIRQENQGNAAARNFGISEAKGLYVVCLDSDDVWAEDMLATCVAEFKRNPGVDVVYTQVRRIDALGRVLPGPVTPKPMNGNLLEPLLMGFPILPSSAMVRRSCFGRWGLYALGLDDWELWLRWAAKNCTFRCIEQPLLFYRIHEANFALNWARRRDIHQLMLDAFYQMDDLPERALELRKSAYLNQFLWFAQTAHARGRLEDYGRELYRMLSLAPDLIMDDDFFVTIACVRTDIRGKQLEPDLRDFHACELQLLTAIDLLFSSGEPDDALGFSRNEVSGRGYLALGRLAYSTEGNRRQTTRLLLESFIRWPAVVLRTDWGQWILRALLGKQAVTYIKQRTERLMTSLT